MAFVNLPGVTVNLNDLGLKIAPPPAGPKVTLLGITSNTSVPVNELLTVTNVGQVVTALWVSGSDLDLPRYPGELAIAVEEAFSAGAPNVEIVNIAVVEGEAFDSYMDPNGGDSRFFDLSGTYDAIQNRDLDIVVPLGAYIDYSGANLGKQLADFCFQATKDVDNAVVGVMSMMPVARWAVAYSGTLALVSSLATEVNLIGSPNGLHFALPSLGLVDEWVKYATQDNSPAVDIDTETNAPVWFNGYLAGSEDTGGIYYPLDNENSATAVNADYFTSWQATNIDGSLALDQKGNKVDAGARLSIVACPLATSTKQIRELAAGVGAALSNTTQTTDGAAAYAGFMTKLAPQSSPTNKRIPNLVAQRIISGAQANKLATRRLVTFHNRANGFVVTNAMTGAYNVSKFVRSDFVRLTTVRVLDAIIDLTRAVAEKYIGEPNTAAQRNALSNEIEKFLKQMRVAGAINGFKFFVSATPSQQVLGEATVDMTIVPPFEIVKITTNISLSPSV